MRMKKMTYGFWDQLCVRHCACQALHKHSLLDPRENLMKVHVTVENPVNHRFSQGFIGPWWWSSNWTQIWVQSLCSFHFSCCLGSSPMPCSLSRMGRRAIIRSQWSETIWWLSNVADALAGWRWSPGQLPTLPSSWVKLLLGHFVQTLTCP